MLKTFEEKSLTEAAVMVSLVFTLTLVSVTGNGSFLAIFARFKIFRNFPNIIFANQALADLLNTLFNLPLFAVYFVLQTDWLKGKTWAIISCSLYLEFTLLNQVSMFAQMLDRFLALELDLKYFTWKTNRKAKIAVAFMWLLCTIMVVLSSTPLFDVNFDGVPLMVSRVKILRQRKPVIAPFMGLLFIGTSVLGIMTSYSISQKKKQRKLLNLPPLQAEARLKMDIKATKTVSMTLVAFYVCYIPAIVFFILFPDDDDISVSTWFTFVVMFCMFAASALSPVIYVLRNRRCRSALRQLSNDPFGKRAFQEKPVKFGKQEKRKLREKTQSPEGEDENKNLGASSRLQEKVISQVRQATAETQTERVVKLTALQITNDKSRGSLEEKVAVSKPQPHHETEKALGTRLSKPEAWCEANDQDFKSPGLARKGAKKNKTIAEWRGKESKETLQVLGTQAVKLLAYRQTYIQEPGT